MLRIIRINYASQNFERCFEGGQKCAEGWSAGFSSAAGVPVLIVLTEAADTSCWEAPDEATAGDGAGPRSVGAAPADAPLPALCPRRWGGKKEKGRAVTSRQPRLQLIFDELIDNKTKKVVVGFEGGFCFC